MLCLLTFCSLHTSACAHNNIWILELWLVFWNRSQTNGRWKWIYTTICMSIDWARIFDIRTSAWFSCKGIVGFDDWRLKTRNKNESPSSYDCWNPRESFPIHELSANQKNVIFHPSIHRLIEMCHHYLLQFVRNDSKMMHFNLNEFRYQKKW